MVRVIDIDDIWGVGFRPDPIQPSATPVYFPPKIQLDTKPLGVTHSDGCLNRGSPHLRSTSDVSSWIRFQLGLPAVKQGQRANLRYLQNNMSRANTIAVSHPNSDANSKAYQASSNVLEMSAYILTEKVEATLLN